MFEPFAIDTPPTEQRSVVHYVSGAQRVVMFDLAVGQALPETRSQPVMLIASTVLDLRVERNGATPLNVRLVPGESLLLQDGVTQMTNQGTSRAQFTLIDLATPLRELGG